jgi:hypothetical protein
VPLGGVVRLKVIEVGVVVGFVPGEGVLVEYGSDDCYDAANIEVICGANRYYLTLRTFLRKKAPSEKQMQQKMNMAE